LPPAAGADPDRAGGVGCVHVPSVPELAGGAWLGMVPGPPTTYLPLPWGVLAAVDVLRWVFILFTLYTIVIPVAGLWTRTLRPAERRPPRSRFAIVVPAHNEERVIANLIDSLHALAYPAHLFDIYVVADNCDDGTAEVAAAAGARVIVRHNPDERGKGYALDYAFRFIRALGERYDAFVVFDADNLVDPDFLNVMNAHLLRGDRVIQGRMDVKNPMDTWLTGTFAMSVWVSNRFWFLAKHNLGFSSVLGGTGMCIDADLIQRIGWGATSFTEDLEFTMKALLLGVKTVWAHDAICYDEKVQTFAASWRQRRRWVIGQTTVARSYLGPMLWRGLSQLSRIHLEAAFQLFQPFYLLLGTSLLTLGYVAPAAFVRDPILVHLSTMWFWGVLTVVEYSMPAAAVLIDRQPLATLRYLPLYPVFLNSWLPLTWAGVFGPRPRHWTHTEHTRAMALRDLQALRAERR
jgi:cellulose synthase/poly-beta-1,6-N-acetylglucosamine synthase-like glycosyltransferase